MNQIIKVFKGKVPVLLFFSFLLSGCIDAVTPEFDYREGLIYIEGLVSTSPGTSFVSVYESATEFAVYQNNFLEGASVSFRNTETDVLVDLIEQEGVYVPSIAFAASVGESWELEVRLLDGRQFQSLSEKIVAPVAISNITAAYDPALFFSEAENDFVPGHSVAVSFNDPPNEVNFYYWRFRSYEPITNCAICYEGTYYRDGACRAASGYTLAPYFTYLCGTDCWRIRYSENVQIFTDDFVNGTSVNNLSVANVPLYTKENIEVEIQQFSLSASAHKYLKALKDVLDNNGGFNAPPAAALIGNMFNPNDGSERVLGRFTAAAVSTTSVFIDRSNIEEEQLENDNLILHDEGGLGVDTPFPDTLSIPCEESRYKTGQRPQEWID